MLQLFTKALSLSEEPAALLKNRVLIYANDGALAILGPDCVGRSLRELFGKEIAETQAPSFAADIPLAGQNRLLRFVRSGELQVVYFSRPDGEDTLFNDATIQALRSALMNISLAVGAGRSQAEELQQGELVRCFTLLTREYYRMNRLLSNISVARSTLAHELSVNLSPVDLTALISDLVDSVSLLRPDVKFSFQFNRRVLLWADAQLLELMLLNLLSNCLTHAAGLSQIRLELQLFSDQIYLTVKDDGCGIPAEKMNHLFHRYRAAYRLSELSMGAGLGLTVIRGVTEAHGGALMLESREGAGTMLRLSLSRCIGSEGTLGEDLQPYAGSMERLLTGLAPCLPPECFGSRYLD